MYNTLIMQIIGATNYRTVWKKYAIWGGGGTKKNPFIKGIPLKRENELLLRFDKVYDLGGGTKKTVR